MANISKIQLPDGVTYDLKDKVSGYSTTDEKLAITNIGSSSSNNGTYYPIIAKNLSSAETRQYDRGGLIYNVIYGAGGGGSNTQGYATLTIGNSYSSITGGNKQGILELYGSTVYKHVMQGAPTADRTLTLPDATGTIALTSDIGHLNMQINGTDSSQLDITFTTTT